MHRRPHVGRNTKRLQQHLHSPMQTRIRKWSSVPHLHLAPIRIKAWPLTHKASQKRSGKASACPNGQVYTTCGSPAFGAGVQHLSGSRARSRSTGGPRDAHGPGTRGATDFAREVSGGSFLRFGARQVTLVAASSPQNPEFQRSCGGDATRLRAGRPHSLVRPGLNAMHGEVERMGWVPHLAFAAPKSTTIGRHGGGAWQTRIGTRRALWLTAGTRASELLRSGGVAPRFTRLRPVLRRSSPFARPSPLLLGRLTEQTDHILPGQPRRRAERVQNRRSLPSRRSPIPFSESCSCRSSGVIAIPPDTSLLRSDSFGRDDYPFGQIYYGAIRGGQGTSVGRVQYADAPRSSQRLP